MHRPTSNFQNAQSQAHGSTDRNSTDSPLMTLENLLQSQKGLKPNDRFWQKFDREWEKTKGKALLAPVTTRIYENLTGTLAIALPHLQTAAFMFLVAAALIFMGLSKSHRSIAPHLIASYLSSYDNCYFVADDVNKPNLSAFNHSALQPEKILPYASHRLQEPHSTSASSQSYSF
jgi:hypothetical protein